MLIAVDIGNSLISIGGFENNSLVFVSTVLSERKTEDQYLIELNNIIKLYNVSPIVVDGAIISSVVPEMTKVFKKVINKLFDVEPLILGPGIKSGINILIDNPAQLGTDLVAAAAAAISKKELPAIIITMEIATTLCVIDKNGNFIGAIICAGVGATADILSYKTAMLPHIVIDSPPSIIGKNTIHSMQSGLIWGTASMIDGLIDKIEKETGKSKIYITGHFAKDIKDHCSHEIELEENLSLEGLKIIYDKNQTIKRL